ncbi:hypothetical protein GEV33_006165 [Tenebrio molitor]|uniref:Cytochrome P450 monooxygenase n=1 Tax=Tenebrio molitor TaxID=7067 RepID=A0A8J6HLR6_TENMO|nr:hypothetical protein GEV33_006165 [Tenebrio molitor]
MKSWVLEGLKDKKHAGECASEVNTRSDPDFYPAPERSGVLLLPRRLTSVINYSTWRISSASFRLCSFRRVSMAAGEIDYRRFVTVSRSAKKIVFASEGVSKGLEKESEGPALEELECDRGLRVINRINGVKDGFNWIRAARRKRGKGLKEARFFQLFAAFDACIIAFSAASLRPRTFKKCRNYLSRLTVVDFWAPICDQRQPGTATPTQTPDTSCTTLITQYSPFRLFPDHFATFRNMSISPLVFAIRSPNQIENADCLGQTGRDGVIRCVTLGEFPPVSDGYQRRKRIWDAIEPFGGEKWYPLVGTCLDLIKASRDNFYEVYSARNKKHGPLFRTWMGSIPAIHVMKPDHIERILNNTVNLTKGDIYKFVEPWLGEGLITGSDHKKWHRHRKLLTPTFHFSVLDNMMEVMTEKGQYLADRLTQKADGKFFNIYPYLTLCELDIICDRNNCASYCILHPEPGRASVRFLGGVSGSDRNNVRNYLRI